MGLRRVWPFALFAVLLLGAGLRLVWPLDIEYKADEAWTFLHTQQARHSSSWRGMPSSVSLPNPGMSLWVFQLLAWVAGAHDPPALARAVQVLDSAALFLLVALACWLLPRQEREAWRWAAALAAVNPLAVLFHRKIWPPSVLPVLTLTMLAGWWRRQHWWGAFLWGLVGICLGQIHMSGFFFAAGFAAWAFLWDRGGVCWKGWLAGTTLGALPLLPWAREVLTHLGQRPVRHIGWVHAFELKFWVRWITEPVGLGLDYSLDNEYGEFLGFPRLAGKPSNLIGLLHGLILIVALAILVRSLGSLWRRRHQGLARWVGRGSPTAFTQNAALWGYGVLLTVSTLSIYRHYLIVAFPLPFVWLARLALADPARPTDRRTGRAILLALCVLEFLLTAGFLSYIHTHPGGVAGDYGTPYRAQSTLPVPAAE